MRDLATRTPVQEAASAPETVRARPSGAALLAVQRSAGNAAATRLVQRTLSFTDAGTTFTDPVKASDYLKSQFTTAKETLTPDAEVRLKQVAEHAAYDQLIETQLAGTLTYIRGATPMDYDELIPDPSKSPAREDPPDWDMETTRDAPSTSMRTPQSPRREFPQREYPDHNVDVKSRLAGQKTALLNDRRARGKEELGNNRFKYEVKAEVRVEPMSVHDRGGTPHYKVEGNPEYQAPAHQSQIYGSQKMLPGPNTGDKQREYATQQRSELDTILAAGRDRDHFHKGSSLYAHEFNRGTVPRPDGYFSDPNTKEASIASLFFHSEVQAATHAHEAAGDALAKDLMAQIETAARAKKVPGQALRIVVLSVDFYGHSDPNTICSGACKGALIHVGEIIEQKFTTYRHSAKTKLNAELIFVRGSQHLGHSGHVAGEQEYNSGYGVGSRPKTAKPMSSYQNHTVREYPFEKAKPPREKKAKADAKTPEKKTPKKKRKRDDDKNKRPTKKRKDK